MTNDFNEMNNQFTSNYLTDDKLKEINALNFDDYNDWWTAGQIFYQMIPLKELGLKEWRRWSQQSSKHPTSGNDEGWEKAWGRIKAGVEAMKNLNATTATDTKPVVATTASMLLGQARDLLDQRARDYDKPQGERSMGTVAKMFNLATQREDTRAISESEAWLVMDLLKIVRDRSTPHGHVDSCEDHVSYAALYGEARLAEKRAAEVTSGMEELVAHATDGFKSVRETYQAECKHDFSNIENFGGAGTAKVAQTLGERVLGTLRTTMVSVIVEVKRQHGSDEALRIVKDYGQANRLPDVQDINIPAVIHGAYVTFGPKLGNDTDF